MFSYAIRRILGAIPTLFVIVALSFFMMRLAPGGPFSSERPIPPAIKANLDRAYGLDLPLPTQFFNYLGNLAVGDLGPSFKWQDYTVNELIAAGFPFSLAIGGIAILLAVVIGMLSGIVAALKQNTAVDYGVMAVAMTGITVPNFVVGPLLILLFGVIWHIFPAGGFSGGWQYFVLPTVALALAQIAYIARMTRGSMIEVLRSNFVRTARAKGLPERITILRHAMRASLIPVVSYLGPATAGIITGSIVIEQIFGIPGVGRNFIQGAINRDYTLVMGMVVFYGSLIIAFNLVVDLVYGLLDPRVRYD